MHSTSQTPKHDTPVFELFAFPEHLEGVPLKVGYVHTLGSGLTAQVTDSSQGHDVPTFDIYIEMKPWAPLPRRRDGHQCFEVYTFREDGSIDRNDLVGLVTREAFDVFTVKVTVRGAVHTLEMRTTGLQRFTPPARRPRAWNNDRSYLLAH